MDNKEFSDLVKAHCDEWVDIECDGCSALLGALPEDEYNEKELYLCSECEPKHCSYTRLEQVDPVKYADEITKQKEACKPVLMTMCQVCMDKGQDTDCANCIPF